MHTVVVGIEVDKSRQASGRVSRRGFVDDVDRYGDRSGLIGSIAQRIGKRIRTAEARWRRVHHAHVVRRDRHRTGGGRSVDGSDRQRLARKVRVICEHVERRVGRVLPDGKGISNGSRRVVGRGLVVGIDGHGNRSLAGRADHAGAIANRVGKRLGAAKIRTGRVQQVIAVAADRNRAALACCADGRDAERLIRAADELIVHQNVQ